MSKQKRRTQSKKPRTLKESWVAWYESKRPLLGFGLRFAGVMAGFYLLSLTPVYKQALSGAVALDARMAHALLQFFGESSAVDGATLRSGGEAIITVEPGCTGFDYSWFLAAAVAAFPAPLFRRILGVVAGVATLLLLNGLRVSSLYWVGVHHPQFFAFVHEQLWAALLNIATVCLMVAWIVWVKQQQRENETPAPA